jgi:hypothetical protein
VNLRYPRRLQHFADLGQEPRNLVEAFAKVRQALGRRREVARQQVVQTVAGDARIDERVPAPVLQLLHAETCLLEIVAQQQGIHLAVARQVPARDARELS